MFEIYNKKNIQDQGLQGHVPGLAIDFGIGGWPRAFGGVLERRSVSWAGSVSWVVIRIWGTIESEFKMLQFPILKGWNDDETWSEGVGADGCQSFSSARSWSSQLSSWALRISCARSCAFGRVTLDFAQGEALTSTSSCEQAKNQDLPNPSNSLPHLQCYWDCLLPGAFVQQILHWNPPSTSRLGWARRPFTDWWFLTSSKCCSCVLFTAAIHSFLRKKLRSRGTLNCRSITEINYCRLDVIRNIEL